MLKFICFGSGSSGNCYYLNLDGHGLLIDEGLGVRTFRKRFADYGLSLAEVKAVLLTHDHADHAKGVGALAMQFGWPVYALPEVFAGLLRNRFLTKKVPAALSHNLEAGKRLSLGPFTAEPFIVPHDSAGCCGFSIDCGERRFCLITDAGHVTDDMRRHLSSAHYVVLESNYDALMLRNGPYPPRLKRRIEGEQGHMDNADAASLLANSLSPLARHVWLCHLSEENNRPHIALAAATDALREAGRLSEGDPLVVETLQRTSPSRLYELE